MQHEETIIQKRQWLLSSLLESTTDKFLNLISTPFQSLVDNSKSINYLSSLVLDDIIIIIALLLFSLQAAARNLKVVATTFSPEAKKLLIRFDDRHTRSHNVQSSSK